MDQKSQNNVLINSKYQALSQELYAYLNFNAILSSLDNLL